MSADNHSRILLLMDNRGDANWGSRATTNCLVALLNERFPNAEIRGADRSAANAVRNYRSLANRWAPSATLRKNNPFASLVAHLALRDLRHFKGWPDLIVVNGEGTLHPNAQARIWMMMIARFLEKSPARLWFVNASIELGEGPTRSAFLRVLNRADRLAVRELETFDHLVAGGLNPIACADAAFLATASDHEAVEAFLVRNKIEGPYAILAGSASAGSWRSENVEAIVSCLQSKGLTVVFCCSTSTDAELAARCAPSLPRFAYPEFDFPQLISLISRAKVHIGGRYHPTLFAAMNNVPFLALGTNTSKIQGALRVMKLPESLLVSIDDPKIAARVDSVLKTETPSIDLNQVKTLARRNVFSD